MSREILREGRERERGMSDSERERRGMLVGQGIQRGRQIETEREKEEE